MKKYVILVLLSVFSIIALYFKFNNQDGIKENFWGQYPFNSQVMPQHTDQNTTNKLGPGLVVDGGVISSMPAMTAAGVQEGRLYARGGLESSNKDGLGTGFTTAGMLNTPPFNAQSMALNPTYASTLQNPKPSVSVSAQGYPLSLSPQSVEGFAPPGGSSGLGVPRPTVSAISGPPATPVSQAMPQPTLTTDRLITVSMLRNKTRGLACPFRGDLPIQSVNCGWYNVPGNVADSLGTGAMFAMGGVGNETSQALAALRAQGTISTLNTTTSGVSLNPSAFPASAGAQLESAARNLAAPQNNRQTLYDGNNGVMVGVSMM